MITLVNRQIHFNDINLCCLKSLVEDESNSQNHKFVLTKHDDTVVEVSHSELTSYEYQVLEAYYHQYENAEATYESDLQLAKEVKIQELDTACTNNILNGFYSDAFEVEVLKLYSFDDQDQTNLMGMLIFTEIYADTVPYNWKAKSELVSYSWTASQISQLCTDAYLSKRDKMLTFHDLRADVNACTTFEQISAIVWTELEI